MSVNLSTNNDNNNNGAGVTFLGLLTIAFIVLKLCGVIHWRWLWVLAPLWIPAVIVVVAALIIVFIVKRK